MASKQGPGLSLARGSQDDISLSHKTLLIILEAGEFVWHITDSDSE